MSTDRSSDDTPEGGRRKDRAAQPGPTNSAGSNGPTGSTGPQSESRRLAALRTLDFADPDGVAKICAALADPSWRIRKEAVAQAAAWPRPTQLIAALIALVEKTADPVVRNSALEALVAGRPHSIQPLCKAVERKSTARKTFIDCLGLIGAPEAVDVLIERLPDPDENVRMAAAEALGKIGGEAAAAALHDGMQQPGLLVPVASLDGLWKIGLSVPLAPLLKLIQTPGLRRPAVRLLGLTGRCEAIEPIVSALSDTLPAVREAALQGATVLHDLLPVAKKESLENRVRSLSAAQRAALARSLHSRDPDCRRAAARVISWLRDPTLIEPLLEASLDPETGESAADALYALAPTVLPMLGRLVDRGSAEVRAAIYCLCPRIPGLPGADTETIIKWAICDLTARDPDSAPAAAAALGVCGDAQAIAPLLDAVCDPEAEPVLARSAAGALGQIGRRDKAAVIAAVKERADRIRPDLLAAVIARLGTAELLFLLRRQALQADAWVRLEATQALSALADVSAAADLAAEMLTDRDPLVRAAAARVLGKGDDRHVSLLRNALADEDEEVRAAAAHALGRLGDVPSADRLRAQALQAATEGRPAEALAAFEGLQVMDQTIDRGLLSTLLQNPDPELVKLALQTAAHHIHPDRGADRGADRDPDRDADREVTGDATKALFDDVLAKLSDDASPWDVRLEAVRALRPRAADPRVCKALQRLLAAETDGLVRQVASEALHATKKGGPS